MKTHAFVLASLTAAVLSLSLASANAEKREWTNSDGKSITGELKGVTGDKAAILVGTRQFDIPLASLSEADRAFISEWQTANSTASTDTTKAYDTPVMKALETNLVGLDGRKIVPFTLDSPEKIEVIANPLRPGPSAGREPKG
jgi:hypothetical protein